MTSLILGWLVFNALVVALLASQAKHLVLGLAGLLLMALWLAFAGTAWFVLSPLFAGRMVLRRFGLLEAA